MSQRILVTGATGFVGRHLVGRLVDAGHAVVAATRDPASLAAFAWGDRVEPVRLSLPATDQAIDSLLRSIGRLDAVAHLAWGHLDNFRSTAHFREELPAAFGFLDAVIRGGCRRLLVTGTCLEYGLQSGRLVESLPLLPVTSYGLAKACLHQFLIRLQDELPFTMTWARLFYLHGEGQSPRSLLPLLRQAIDRGDESFAMSGGEQLRDYLSVEEVAGQLKVLLTDVPACDAINVCSGQPISVRRFVQQTIERWGATIPLRLGVYPYPDYEPLAFWGDNDKFKSLGATA